MNRLSTLYRPVGVKELTLIQAADYQVFPPRLDWQPLFYPVLNRQYAIEIAQNWNTKDEASGYAGFVTAFDLPKAYLKQFQVQNVGGARHNELWVPAEELSNFNQQIQGKIRILDTFYGAKYREEPRLNIIN